MKNLLIKVSGLALFTFMIMINISITAPAIDDSKINISLMNSSYASEVTGKITNFCYLEYFACPGTGGYQRTICHENGDSHRCFICGSGNGCPDPGESD